MCVHELDAQALAAFGSTVCKNGIDGEALELCLSKIREEQCNSPLDALQRIVMCDTRSICSG
jgi:hypothetical protein